MTLRARRAPNTPSPRERDGSAARLRHLPVLVRAATDTDAPAGSFVAVGATYGLEYEIGWGWREILEPGVFAASIEAHPAIPIFWQHRWDMAPIGVGAPEEANLDGKDVLLVRGQLLLDADDPLVRRVHAAMLAGAVEEWSIGYYAEEIAWSKDDPELDRIVAGDLAELSSVVRGANPETGTVELAGLVDEPELRRRMGLEQPPADEPAVDVDRLWAAMATRGGREALRAARV